MTKKSSSLKRVFVTTGNPQRLAQALGELEADADSLERIVVGFGPAGRGKTAAGIWLAGADPERRIYVRALQVWSTIKMLQDLGRALGRSDMPSTSGKAYDALIERVGDTARTTLIIDEANYLKQYTLNVLRDLHDEAGLTLVLLGEQKIKEELEKHTRLRSRVVHWQTFSALAEAEAHLIAQKLLPDGVTIEAEAAKKLLAQASGLFRDYVNLLRASLRLAQANDQDKITTETALTLGRRLRVA